MDQILDRSKQETRAVGDFGKLTVSQRDGPVKVCEEDDLGL